MRARRDRVATSRSKATGLAVTKPAGIITVKALPPEFAAILVGSLTYFVAFSRHYVPYPSGKELYLVVNPPRAVAVPPSTAPASPPANVQAATTASPKSDVSPVKIALTLNAGTLIPVHVTGETGSATAKTGKRFHAYLQNDLTADGRFIAAKGTRAYGRVAEAKAGSGMGAAPVWRSS